MYKDWYFPDQFWRRLYLEDDRLQKGPIFCLKAVAENRYVLQYVDNTLKEDKTFCLRVMRKNGKGFGIC